jgi:superfamily I DNA/RNA helicase
MQDGSEKATKPFAHLLIDEFQDINDVQYRLIRAWSQNSAGLFVIGDPDQSIYGFRGSDPRFFERLVQDFPDTRRIRLTRNYRSTPVILRCAASALPRTEENASSLEAIRESGAPVRVVEAVDELAQGIFVAKEIVRMVGGIDMLGAHASR